MPLDVRSIRIRWLSVPPDTRSNPRATSASASAFALVTTCCAYVRNSGCAASCRATAIAAVVWLCGPPCSPGKTARSRGLACSASDMIIAPRGPRRVRAPGDQAGDVGDVGDQHRPHLVGDLGEGREVDGARDGRPAAEDQL